MIQSFYYQQMQEDIRDRALLLRPHIQTLLIAPDEQLQEFCRQTGRTAAPGLLLLQATVRYWPIPTKNLCEWIITVPGPKYKQPWPVKVGSSLRLSKTLNQNMLYVALPLNEDKHGKVCSVLRSLQPLWKRFSLQSIKRSFWAP